MVLGPPGSPPPPPHAASSVDNTSAPAHVQLLFMFFLPVSVQLNATRRDR